MTNQLNSSYYHWRYWSLVPIYPYSKRRTICREIIADTIWTFDQLQGIFYVIVPIRMTVVKLEAGGLLVYAPVAPTLECLDLLNEIVARHGEVKYIILPTISGLEHKVFVGPFARNFPAAEVFIAPKQWSFPLNLPLSWLGFPANRTHILPQDSKQAPFGDEFDYAILGDIDLKLGQFEEVAFFHKSSQTLLVTDIVVSIPQQPPAIVQLDPYPLLFHARDSALEVIEDNYANRLKGWQRICLFAMYFRSSVLEVPKLGKVLEDSFKSPERSTKAYLGLYPFKWLSNWQDAYHILSDNGRLLVAPILQTLILNRAPQVTLDWADLVASWNFTRIISCHFDHDVIASPSQFRQAFSFLGRESADNWNSSSQHLPEEDLQLLQNIDLLLSQSRVVPPPKK